MPRELVCHPRQPKRLWTIADYEGLTADLLPRFGPKELMCANFRAIDVDPSAILNDVIETIESASGEEEFSVWLRGVLAALILIWGYVKKIATSRLYRLVLRRFIVIALLVAALERILGRLIDFLEVLVLQIDELKRLHELIDCEDTTDEF